MLAGDIGDGNSNPVEEVDPNQQPIREGSVASSTFHKLPVFWSNVPEVWFIQVEQIFNLNRITSDVSKYRHVVAVLPQEAMGNVIDILRQPPTENKYNTLKEALISRHSISENRKLESLLNSSEMGDRSPSSFYREMENLMGNSNFINQSLLKKLWLRKLPESVRLAVTCSNIEEVTALLSMADKIWEVTQNSQLSAVASSSSSDKEDKLLNAIKTLTLEVCSLKEKLSRNSLRGQNNYQRRRGRSTSRSTSRSSSRSRSGNRNDNYCWYHSNFADKASKCIPPCQYAADKKKDTNLNM